MNFFLTLKKERSSEYIFSIASALRASTRLVRTTTPILRTDAYVHIPKCERGECSSTSDRRKEGSIGSVVRLNVRVLLPSAHAAASLPPSFPCCLSVCARVQWRERERAFPFLPSFSSSLPLTRTLSSYSRWLALSLRASLPVRPYITKRY